MTPIDDLQRQSPYPTTSAYIRYHAALRPKSVAVVDQGNAYSYRDFNRDIGKMLAALEELKLSPGQMVGVEFLPVTGNFSSFYFHWVQLLALETLGIATMSFTRMEAPHMKHICRSLDLVLVFPDGADLPAKRCHIMDKDWISQSLKHDPVIVSDQELRPSDAAVRIIKSSGTTGTMKCMVRSIENQEFIYRNTQFRGGYNQQSRFFAAGGFSVSAFHAPAVTCIRAGGSCFYDTRQNTAAALASYAITHASFLVHSLMKILEHLPEDYKKPPDLKILTIGSPLSDAVRARLLTSLVSQVIETYGANESSTISAIDPSGAGTILPGVGVEVVDDDDTPLIGETGWIRVRSPGCVRGYLNDPQGTEKMFRDGWFYPGDLGIMQDAHTLRMIGRADSLLNIRGVKYPPQEFEEKILDALPVRDVCMLTIPDHENVEQVVIAVVPEPNTDQDELTLQIRPLVPSIFGTTFVTYVTHMPRTESGKIERQALRQALRNLDKE